MFDRISSRILTEAQSPQSRTFDGGNSQYSDGLAAEALQPFDWRESKQEIQRGPLFDWHVAHGAKMAPFAGWEMPTWYSSIGD